jgi:hypothetical protein
MMVFVFTGQVCLSVPQTKPFLLLFISAKPQKTFFAASDAPNLNLWRIYRNPTG